MSSLLLLLTVLSAATAANIPEAVNSTNINYQDTINNGTSGNESSSVAVVLIPRMKEGPTNSSTGTEHTLEHSSITTTPSLVFPTESTIIIKETTQKVFSESSDSTTVPKSIETTPFKTTMTGNKAETTTYMAAIIDNKAETTTYKVTTAKELKNVTLIKEPPVVPTITETLKTEGTTALPTTTTKKAQNQTSPVTTTNASKETSSMQTTSGQAIKTTTVPPKKNTGQSLSISALLTVMPAVFAFVINHK